MTKKDYVLIAQALNNTNLDTYTLGKVVAVVAEALTSTNPRFDRAHFIAACMKGH